MRVSVRSSPSADGTGPTRACDDRFLHHQAWSTGNASKLQMEEGGHVARVPRWGGSGTRAEG